jgi:hypothetical protein
MIYQGFGLATLFGLDPKFNLWAFLGGMGLSGSPLAIQALALLTGRSSQPAEPSPSREPSTPSSGG